MGFCMAAFGWTARAFMDSTNHEIFAGYESWRSMNCAKES